MLSKVGIPIDFLSDIIKVIIYWSCVYELISALPAACISRMLAMLSPHNIDGMFRCALVLLRSLTKI